MNLSKFLPRAPLGWDIRLAVVFFLCIAISLPMALVSLAKVALFVLGAACIIRRPRRPELEGVQTTYWTPPWVLLTLAAFALSLSWSVADFQTALTSFVKHAKLLEIAILIALIRSTSEARWAMAFLFLGQVLVLASTLLMAAGVPIFWTPRASGLGEVHIQYVPFADSYLDQSIMLTVTAAVAWHMRTGGVVARRATVFFVGLSFFSVFFLFPARTAYLIAFAIICVTALWHTPRAMRLYVPVLGAALVGLLLLSSPHFRERIFEARSDIQTHQAAPQAWSPVGIRLDMWRRSLETIADNPVLGQGVGAWSSAIGSTTASVPASFSQSTNNNPHQEFLLWGVELGIGGPLLLIGLLIAVMRDGHGFSTPTWRALATVVLALAIACLFNSTLYDDLIGDYFCVLLGVLLAHGAGEARLRGRTLRPD